MDSILLQPIAFIYNNRREVSDDLWGDVISEIHLVDSIPDEAFDGIETFSHIEVIYHFDRVVEEKVIYGARHPRGNSEWPRVGIFAQRGKNRPNRIGLSTAQLLERKGRVIRVAGLDAIDCTPVLDIKPVMQEFLPREEVKQPEWVSEIMRRYWYQ